MKATFLVELEIDDISPLALIEASDELHDAAEKAGFVVESVKPWSRPTAPAMGLSDFMQSLPEQTTQQNKTQS